MSDNAQWRIICKLISVVKHLKKASEATQIRMKFIFIRRKLQVKKKS